MTATGSSDRHSYYLSVLCRLCGGRIKRSSRNPQGCTGLRIRNKLAEIGIDITCDDPDVHPKSLCSSCYHSLMQNRKYRECWNITCTWEKHVDHTCPTCIKGEKTAKGGAPVKKKRGRPPFQAPKVTALTKESDAVPDIQPPQALPCISLVQNGEEILQTQMLKALPITQASVAVPTGPPIRTSLEPTCLPVAQTVCHMGGNLQVQTPMIIPLTQASETVPLVPNSQLPLYFPLNLAHSIAQTGGGILQTQNPLSLTLAQQHSEIPPVIPANPPVPTFVPVAHPLAWTLQGIPQTQTLIPTALPVTQPLETVPLTQPSETVPLTQPSETVTLTQPSETVPQIQPLETVPLTQPSETVPLTHPSELVPLTQPSETVQITHPSETAPLTQNLEVPPTSMSEKTGKEILHIDAMRNFSVEIKCKECLSLVSLANIGSHSCIVIPPTIALHDHTYIHVHKEKTRRTRRKKGPCVLKSRPFVIKHRNVQITCRP